MNKYKKLNIVGMFLRSLPAFVFIFFSAVKAVAAPDYKMPDFAFPQTVVEQSDSLILNSLREHHPVEAIRGFMNLSVARGLLSDSNNVGPLLEKADSLADKLGGDYKNICYLLEGEILAKTYLDNRYVFDQRNLPIEGEFPLDTEEWSGGMFKERVWQLMNKINDSFENNFRGNSVAQKQTISEIALLIDDYATAEKIGLTIEQFITFKAVDILKKFSGPYNESVIPFYPSETPATPERKCLDLALKMLGELGCQFADGNSVVRSLAVFETLSLLPDYEVRARLDEALENLNGQEGEGLLLYEYWSRYFRGNSESETAVIYERIGRWLSQWPDGFYFANLSYARDMMARQNIEVSFPKTTLPATPIKGRATVENLNKAYLHIIKLAENQVTQYDEAILKKIGSPSPFTTIEIGGEGNVPFQYSQDIEIEGLKPGIYLCVPSATPTLPKNWNKTTSNASYSTIRVTDITLMTTFDSNQQGSGRVYVVNGHDQQPVAGAVVTYFKGNGRKAEGKAVTNSQGWVSIPEGYFRIEAKKGNSLAKRDAGFSYYPVRSNKSAHASILTDLAIYRPGDTVRFAVVGWQQENKVNSLMPGQKVELTMRDANYSNVGTLSLTLDQSARASGEMVIPKGRLLGTYQLTASFSGIQGGGSTSFQVEEYKLPAFLVTLKQEESLSPDSISFRGMAATYSGMPVTDAEIEYEVHYLPWRWGGVATGARYNVRGITDTRGEFTLTLPLTGLKGTPYAQGRYSLTANVTSTAGETESSQPLMFYLGRGIDIRPQIGDKTEITGDSVIFSIPVYDMAGLPVTEKIDYRLINQTTGDTISGSFISPSLIMAANTLASGKYRMEFRSIDDDDMSGYGNLYGYRGSIEPSQGEMGYETVTETVVWRPSETKAPFPTPLWVPQREITFREDEKFVDVVFGSYWNDWILYTLSDGESVLECKWLEPKEDNALLRERICLPEGVSKLFVNLCGMHDFQPVEAQITLSSEKSLEKMELISESFRDQLTAGDLEKWTFKIKIGESPASNSNVFAVMSDKALNSLKDFKWNMNIWTPSIYNWFRISPVFPGRSISFRNFSLPTDKNFVSVNSAIPSWQTYGFPLSGGLSIHGPVYLYSAKAASRTMMTDSAADLMEAETSEEAVESPMMAAGQLNMKQEERSRSSQEEFRPVEMPLAFFRPDLSADANGEVELNFIVPNFNTTWQLQLAAYNDELKNATLLLDAVASKPVMVKSNLPQYVRTGDKAELSATLFNNTEQTQSIGGSLEIIDATTGMPLKAEEFSPLVVEPSGNRVVSMRFEVPSNLSGLIVRAVASGENHRDGEQGIIPVLPSSAPLIEATTFYANAETEVIEIKVPRLSKDANLTLKYCDNPLWEVLLSLPGLTDKKTQSSLAIAEWLYGTLLARDIIGSSPEIADGLQRILNSPDSSLSMSNLQKDENLKITRLEASPWLNSASAETSRIRSLGKYFDTAGIDNEVTGKIQKLSALQRPDGGWTWFEGMQSSPYITLRVLNILGYLNSKGLLNASLQKMAQKGINYYDSWLLESVKNNRTPGITSLLDYFYVRKLIGSGVANESGKSLKQIYSSTLDSLSKDWRHFSVGEKAKVALLFFGEPAYQGEGETITRSLTQFTDKRLSMGESSLLLSLFNLSSEYSESVDKLREKLLLRKETQAWGDESDSPALIYSLMEGEKQNIGERSLPEIYVDGRKITLPEQQALTGNFTISLDAKEVSGKKIEIVRQGGLPAWGGVISQSVSPVKSVKSVRVENLAIEKKIYKVVTDGGRETLKEVSKLNKGDKAKIVMTLTCGKDMDYVVVADSGSAALRNDDPLSGIVFIDGMMAYRENRTDRLSFFIERLQAGKHVITYDCHVEREGSYCLGIAEVQCLYSPAQVAHSAGRTIEVDP
ncbi:MAG: hypothetical protein J1D77_01400 [Muribaculaceae bacterium]|nr:hypothetical protein [Muribaculaceae bacterium]